MRRVRVRTVFAVSLGFYFVMLLIVLAGGTVLWEAAAVSGAVGHLESLAVSIGLEPSRHLGLDLFEVSALTGLGLVVLATLVTTLAAAVYNAVSGAVGGVTVTAVERRRRAV